MPLCKLCTDLPANWLVPRFFALRDIKWPESEVPLHWQHHSSWQSLEASAASCDLCALIVRESIDDSEYKEASASVPSSAVRLHAYAGSYVYIRCIEQRKSTVLHLAFDDGM